MRARAWGLCLGPLAAARPVLAEAMPPDVQLEADEVDVDARVHSLVVRGHVVVLCERFRLTSPSLLVERTAHGVRVDGRGKVVFCPCPDPPFAVGFSGATVAPPADLFLTGARLELWGQTVFLLPWFWLRAPTRVGLLPPVVAWRGHDGLLVGEGLHLPWRDAALDVTAAGYVNGGVELTARLDTPRSSGRARWDRASGDLVALDARGSAEQPDDGAIGWDADVIRGSRARSGTISMDEAARAYDHGAGEIVLRLGPAVMGAGVRASGTRGGDRLAYGPSFRVGAGGAMGTVGSWDGASSLTVVSDRDTGTTEIVRLGLGAEAGAHAGPIALHVTVRDSTTEAEGADGGGVDAAAAAELDAGLPLIFVGGDERGPIQHELEPLVSTAVLASHTAGAVWSRTGAVAPIGEGAFAVASGGLRTAWGRLPGRSGASVQGTLGAIEPIAGDAGGGARALSRWRAAWSSTYFGTGGEGAVIGGSEAAGQVTVARARIGRADGVRAALDVAGRSFASPLLARALAPARAEEPSGGWLGTSGWSAAAELAVPISSVEIGAAIDDDLTSGSLLGARGWASYRHPCRCLGLDAFGARRMGRGGVDVWVSVDLAPR
jgi:hypothetical protein